MKYLFILVFFSLIYYKERKKTVSDSFFDKEQQFYVSNISVIKKNDLLFLKFNRTKVNTVIASVNNNEGNEVCESWNEIEYNAPRSGIYFKTTDIELDHTRAKIIANHKKGLYFLQIKREKRVYFLNRETEIFRIHNKSVHITEGTDEQKRREGPICSNVYMFDSENNVLEINCEVSDNHIEFWKNRGISNKYLLDSSTSFIDKEILLNISTGKVKAKEGNKWSDIINLNSFILNESDECNKRLTYLEDTYTESETVRRNNCSSITELDINILPNNSLYPHSLKRMKYNDLRLAFSNDASDYNYRYNVVNDNGEIQKATICYLGFASDIDIEKTYDELQKLFEKGSVGIDTIVVYYKRGNSILNKSNPDAGDFTRIPTNQISITD